MLVLYLKARLHNHQLLCLVLLVEKEILVSWKGDLHNGKLKKKYMFLVVCSNTHFYENFTRWQHRVVDMLFSEIFVCFL